MNEKNNWPVFVPFIENLLQTEATREINKWETPFSLPYSIVRKKVATKRKHTVQFISSFYLLMLPPGKEVSNHTKWKTRSLYRI